MKIRSDEFNIKFLSIISYVGPLFFMAKFSAEQNHPDVHFHQKQGQRLFVFIVSLYIMDILLHQLLRELLPTVASTVFYVFAVIIVITGVCTSIYGIYSAVKCEKNIIPIVGFKL